MELQELAKVLEQAAETGKYVWLKHRADRSPILHHGSMRSDGSLSVPLYLSCIDDYEGLQIIRPSDVEWAHVSNQTVEAVLRQRMDHAEATQTLIRVYFSDGNQPVLFKHSFYTRDDHGCFVVGYFVSSSASTCATERSKIYLRTLNDLENTTLENSSPIECDRFFDDCENPNLFYFAERTE